MPHRNFRVLSIFACTLLAAAAAKTATAQDKGAYSQIANFEQLASNRFEQVRKERPPRRFLPRSWQSSKVKLKWRC